MKLWLTLIEGIRKAPPQPPTKKRDHRIMLLEKIFRLDMKPNTNYIGQKSTDAFDFRRFVEREILEIFF